MKRIELVVGLVFGIILISILGVFAENQERNNAPLTEDNSLEISCKNLYFYDNSVRECGYKKFCGAYMYEGLHTFETVKECQAEMKGVIFGNKTEGEDETNGPGRGKAKILPETASQRARERLGELGFNITLKEIGTNKSVYIAEAEKQGKFLGIFKTKANISAEIDSETGEVIKIHKPWWGFLAGI